MQNCHFHFVAAPAMQADIKAEAKPVQAEQAEMKAEAKSAPVLQEEVALEASK